MTITRLATCFLAIGSYAAATGQTPGQKGSASVSNSGLLSSIQQFERDNSPRRLRQCEQTLLNAKTVFVIVAEPSTLYPTAKAEQALKKALTKWGRFQLVDDAATADLIITIADYSSSKRLIMEHVRESMAVFAGGSMLDENETPLWSVDETGPAFGSKRPTRRLVEDFKKDLTEIAKSACCSDRSITVPQSIQNDVH